jgi:hypothetical protein
MKGLNFISRTKQSTSLVTLSNKEDTITITRRSNLKNYLLIEKDKNNLLIFIFFKNN